jgi:poly-gamma-glutamate capsule biosynthesis protein CapA/YwtB (metallophosphatase superfamily)
MLSIVVGGDICPIGLNEPSFQSGDANEIFKDTMIELESADLSVCNLESPLINVKTPMKKTGANFGVSPLCINGIIAGKFDAINLANNHALDHGELGLRSTINTFEEAGIAYFGAGKNREAAGKILIKDIKGKRIGFLGVAEHEFSIAGSSSWGANPMDIIDVTKAISVAKKQCDFIVMLIHGGKEHYPYPTPYLQKYSRFMVDQGVGAIICQHSHCVGSFEYYKGAPIIYGQGNFIFEAAKGSKSDVLEGMLIKLILENDQKCTAQWIPIHQSYGRSGVQLMLNERREEILDGFNRRSVQILDQTFVNNQWLEECRKDKYNYTSNLMGYSRLFRFLNRKLHFSNWLYGEQSKMLQRNVVRCETHKEALETIWQLDD